MADNQIFVVVKGSAEHAAFTAAFFGFEFELLNDTNRWGEVTGYVSPVDWAAIHDWFDMDRNNKPPFKPGSLLLFN